MSDYGMCGMVSLSGRLGEPLACGHPKGHGGEHSWASLPTFVSGEPAERNPLKRLPRTEYEDQPRYFHPHGYVIERNKRTWSERVGREHGQADHASPMYWWEVRNHIARRRSLLEGKGPAFLAATSVKPDAHRGDFESLREARAWCDEHPRKGWIA